jgi:ABC-type dipeptide/oligopeptide/nickel transport system ATPase component
MGLSRPVLGEPGTGKSVIKESVRQKTDRRTVIVSVNRTMHTYSNTLKILCNSLWDIFDEDFMMKMRQNPSQQIISDIDDPFPF